MPQSQLLTWGNASQRFTAFEGRFSFSGYTTGTQARPRAGSPALASPRPPGHDVPVEIFDDEALQSVGELLALGERLGFGITFEPDVQGWKVGYLRGMGGGDLASGYDLGDTARAALRPLDDLAREYEKARRERERDL